MFMLQLRCPSVHLSLKQTRGGREDEELDKMLKLRSPITGRIGAGPANVRVSGRQRKYSLNAAEKIRRGTSVAYVAEKVVTFIIRIR